MQAYSVPSGENVERTAANIVVIANHSGEQVTATFNGVQIFASPGGSTEDIVAKYYAERDRRHEERKLIDNAVRYRSALAWRIYCEETRNGKTYWHELPDDVRESFLKRADEEAVSRIEGEFRFGPKQ